MKDKYCSSYKRNCINYLINSIKDNLIITLFAMSNNNIIPRETT